MSLEIESLSSTPQREAFIRTFCDAAQRLRKDPYRVGLLSPQADTLFLSAPLSTKQFWVVREGRILKGRIGASVSATDPTRGTVGFFEVAPTDERSAALLLETALAWLREQGVRTAHGPIHINTWFPYRFRIRATDSTHFSWEPVNPPTYPTFFQQAGFTQDQLYHSELMTDLASIVRGFEHGYARSISAGYTYRPLRTGPELEEDIGILFRLSTLGFASNYLFEPITEPIFRMLYVAQARNRQLLGSFFVTHPQNEEVGFFVCFVDEANQFIGKSLVVLPGHQGQGLSLGLQYKSFGAALEAGHQAGVGALLQTGNRSEAASRRSSLGWQHQYALYRKEL